MSARRLVSRPARSLATTSRATGVLAVALLTATRGVGAQARAATPVPVSTTVTRIAQHPAVKSAFAAIQRDNAWTLEQQVALCEIPAPPFKESVRAAAFRDRLVALGVQHVRIDREGNVFGELRGVGPGPTVMLSGHLDTVFPEGTDVKVKREGTKFSGPGIGDDCRGLAVTLAAVRQIVTAKVPFTGRLLVVGTVGEEGPGNLRGVRAIFASPLKDSVNVFLSVDGTGIAITNGAVGSNRYRVSYVGPGGHSYGAFGMPNPIHAMGRAIAKIADLQATTEPKVTFNVGIVSGGTSVNSIPDKGVMDIDLRSESATALADIDGRLQAALREALREERARWPKSKVALDMKIDTIGLRPAGRTPDSANVVVTALAAAHVMNLYAPLTTSSTDANVPISLGIPALTLDGGGVGRSSHSLDESYDDRTDGFKGPQWVLLVVLGLLGVR
jgi:acetylornithine deacetylase/succinyl-diaminopimelate desuccinylase-like protein